MEKYKFNPNVTLFMKNWELTMKQLARMGFDHRKLGVKQPEMVMNGNATSEHRKIIHGEW